VISIIPEIDLKSSLESSESSKCVYHKNNVSLSVKKTREREREREGGDKKGKV